MCSQSTISPTMRLQTSVACQGGEATYCAATFMCSQSTISPTMRLQTSVACQGGEATYCAATFMCSQSTISPTMRLQTSDACQGGEATYCAELVQFRTSGALACRQPAPARRAHPPPVPWAAVAAASARRGCDGVGALPAGGPGPSGDHLPEPRARSSQDRLAHIRGRGPHHRGLSVFGVCQPPESPGGGGGGGVSGAREAPGGAGSARAHKHQWEINRVEHGVAVTPSVL